MNRREILELLEKRTPAGRPYPFEREQVAAAALLVECAQADPDFAPQEHQAIWAALRWQFGLDEQTCEALIGGAGRSSEEVWHDWPFLEAVKRGFTQPEQRGILDRLWEVAQADGQGHPFEVHLIARAARELCIARSTLEETRFRAERRRAASHAGLQL